jgi:hypothetical protein
MRSLILLLMLVFPWLLVFGLSGAAVYIGAVVGNKELTVMCGLGAGLAAVFLAFPATMMVLAALFPESKDKK